LKGCRSSFTLVTCKQPWANC